jgi:predicted translin family RNA/ssDNA-binding protein
MQTASRIDVLLSTLNATEVGTLDSIAGKLDTVREELLALSQPELAARAAEAIAALRRGDVAEFKRGRAFLQSKIGHLRE